MKEIVVYILLEQMESASSLHFQKNAAVCLQYAGHASRAWKDNTKLFQSHVQHMHPVAFSVVGLCPPNSFQSLNFCGTAVRGSTTSGSIRPSKR